MGLQRTNPVHLAFLLRSLTPMTLGPWREQSVYPNKRFIQINKQSFRKGHVPRKPRQGAKPLCWAEFGAGFSLQGCWRRCVRAPWQACNESSTSIKQEGKKPNQPNQTLDLSVDWYSSNFAYETVFRRIQSSPGARGVQNRDRSCWFWSRSLAWRSPGCSTQYEL